MTASDAQLTELIEIEQKPAERERRIPRILKLHMQYRGRYPTDHFWAFAMAESAAAQPQYGLFELWRLQAEAIERGESAELGQSLADAQKREAEIFGNMRMNDRLFWKKRSRTLQCPECGNKNLALHGDVERCNPCGWKHELPAFVFPAKFS